MGGLAARIICAELAGAIPPRTPGFHYRDLGAMATIGRSRAVVEIGPFRFGGFLAWLAWLCLHITVLVGFRNRVAVLSSWFYSYFSFQRGARLIIDAHPEPIKRLAPCGRPLDPYPRAQDVESAVRPGSGTG